MDSFVIIAAALLVSLGALAGLLAGLFGIGGGVVLVPGLYYVFQHFGYEAHAMHMAVGTSLLTIVLTSTSSAYAHYKRDAIDFSVFGRFIIGIVAGVGVGTVIAGHFDVNMLKAVFASVQIIFGLYLLLTSRREAFFTALPRQPWTSLVAAGNACLATLMGVGGGVQNVLFMTICGVPMHRAVATASALGVVIAVFGALGFVLIGQGAVDLPDYSFGYIYMPAFICIVISSVLTAPLGAALAHYLPVARLRKAFSVFMLLVAIKMIAELI